MLKKRRGNAVPTPIRKKTAPNSSNKVSIRLQRISTLGLPVSL